MTTIAKQGRRFYLQGLPFAEKDRAKSLGCKWDSNERAWWTGKLEVAEQLVKGATGSADASGSTGATGSGDAPGESAIVAARVTYKGKTYYAAGRIVRGRTRYDDQVDVITTRDGSKWMLYFRDGSKSFWSARSELQVVKSYNKPQSIGGLKRYADEIKRAGGHPGEGYYVRNGEVLASGCGTCSQLGRMCPSCQHDYE